MEKRMLTILLLLVSVFAKAQPAPSIRGTDEEKLTTTLKEFHQALVTKNTVSINQQTDKVLSYGHSNGWVETKTDMIKNIETGYMDYHSYKEDSLQVMINENMGHARFVADINVTLNGNTGNYHLKVLEVWVKKGKRWLLFARQAIKPPVAEPAKISGNGFYKVYETKETESLKEILFKPENKTYYIESDPSVGADMFQKLSYTLSKSPTDMNVLNVTLSENGTEQFRKLTEKCYGKHLALMFNDEVLLVAKVASVISTGKLSIYSLKNESELKDLIAQFKK